MRVWGSSSGGGCSVGGSGLRSHGSGSSLSRHFVMKMSRWKAWHLYKLFLSGERHVACRERMSRSDHVELLMGSVFRSQ